MPEKVKEEPSVSLCFLSFNRPNFLKEAVESAIENTGYHNYEVIVHDDGSESGAPQDMIQGLLASEDIDKAIFNPHGRNEGVGNAIKSSFDLARGDILIKLDDDLLFKPNWLRKVVDIIKSDRRVALLGLFHYHHDPVDSAKTKIMQFDGWQNHTHICGSGFAVPRWVYEKWGISTHSEAFAEDYELMMKIKNTQVYMNALPNEDLVENRGFGLQHSTIALDEKGRVLPIHKPKIK